MKEKAKILIIDDDFFIRTLVKDIFWVHGNGKYEIFEAENISQGEDFLKKEKPDLIFLDLMFPEEGMGIKTALGFLEKIKSNPETKDIKVIVYSGYPDLKKRSSELGAEVFLIKGEQLPKELVEIVEKLLKRK